MMVAAAVTSTLILDLDVVVTAKGTVGPGTTIPIVQLGDSGVLKAIYVQEGSKVKKGDLLLELDSQFIEADILAISEKISQITAKLNRIKYEQLLVLSPNMSATSTLIDSLPSYQTQELLSRISAYRANVSSAQLEIAMQQTKAQGAAAVAEQYRLSAMKASQLQNRYQQLLKEGFISEAALDDKAITAFNLSAQYKEQLILSKQADTQRNLATANLQRLQQDYLKELSTEHTVALEALASAKLNLNKLKSQLEYKKLKAPASGTISGLQVLTAQQVLSTGARVADVVPYNTTFTFEGWLRDEDLPQITIGKPAKVKLTAYPFQKYGWLDAKITWVGLNSETPPELRNSSAAYKLYKVRAVLQPSPHFKLKEPLRAGMEAQLDIYQGTRTVFEYLVHPIIGVASNALHEK